MTLAAELRAEADSLQYAHALPEKTRAILHRAADALDAAERGVITMQTQADDCLASYRKRYCRQCDAAYSVLSNRACILHRALSALPTPPADGEAQDSMNAGGG